MNAYDVQLRESVFSLYSKLWCEKCHKVPKLFGRRACKCGTRYSVVGDEYKSAIFTSWKQNNRLEWRTYELQRRGLKPSVQTVALIALCRTCGYAYDDFDYLVTLTIYYERCSLSLMEFIHAICDEVKYDDPSLLEKRSIARTHKHVMDMWDGWDGKYKQHIEWLPREMVEDTLDLIGV